ncbi:MAG TPA: Hsp20/alpha crystallin family protein [Acidimicrobiales bacterium]|nr:Hsp20/alpha crystallin family protein [Acidimicrobiales bacterium]
MTMALPVRRSNGKEAAGVSRQDPIGELDRLNRQLGHYLDSWSQLPSLLGEGFTPLADIEETSDAYTIEVELPGLKRDDVDIEIAGRRLSVTGERKERERVGILRRRERVVGQFHYEVVLPGEVEEDGVEAHLDEGVLTIRVPKPASERPRRIEIR